MTGRLRQTPETDAGPKRRGRTVCNIVEFFLNSFISLLSLEF